MKKARKKSLEKKLAAAISVVNLLNAAAPVALPYVNLTRNTGGVSPGALVNVAEANEYYYEKVDYVLNVNYGDTTTIGELSDAWVNVGGTNIIKKVTGGMQLVGGNGVGQIDLNLYGGQVLSYGNSHGNITLLSGGYQAIEHNASGTIETMNGGKQSVSGGYAANGQDRDSKGIGSVGTLNGGVQSVGYDGGTVIARTMNGGTQVAGGYHEDLASVGTMNGGAQLNWGHTTVIDVMNGGTQLVGEMDTTNWHTGNIGTMKGGTQKVWWGAGNIDVLSGGTQYLESLPFQATVSVGTMYGGTQVITNYQDKDPRSGGGIISTMIGGVQDLGTSTWGMISSMSGGTQIASSSATGTISSMSGGTQIVSSSATGMISSFLGGTQVVLDGGSAQNEKVSSGAVLEEHPGAKFTNVTYAGGTHRIVGLEKNGYAADNRTLEIGSGAKTSGTQVKAGSMEVVLEGGSSIDTVIESGGSQIVSGGSASLADLGSGATQTVLGGSGSAKNIKSGGMQVVSGGSATAENLEFGGEQNVYGGVGTVTNLKVGGTQYVYGGTGVLSTVSGGVQVAKDDWKDSTQVVSGGVGKIGTLVNNGNQIISGGTGIAENIGKDGFQYVIDGVGVVETLTDRGQQHVLGGTGTIATMKNGLQEISAAYVSVTVRDGGVGTIEVFRGGTQHVKSGGTGSVGTLAGGRIEMYSGGAYKGNITGYGTLWNVNMGGTVTASGGIILGSNLSVGTLAVADGGSVSIYTDVNNPNVVGNIRANTLSPGTTPTNAKNPLVTATGNITVNTVDFTGLKAEQAPEEYTFVSAGGALSDLTVKRNDFTAALTSGGKIEGKKSRETTAPTEVLTLGYEVAHTLSHTGKALTYKFENTGYTDAAFDGAVDWSAGGTYFDAKDYAFVSNPSVDLAKLGFSFTKDETAAASLQKGQSMTLLANVSGATISEAAPTSFAISQTGHNTALSGTAHGEAAVDGSTVKYTLDGVTLDNVTVTSVNGAADKVPDGWTANTAGVKVDAGSFKTPMSAIGDPKTLLTASTAMFSDSNITGANKYATGKTFSDADKGVTISGKWFHGVYAADETGKRVTGSTPGTNLVFDAGDVNADKIELGAMTWNAPRALDGKYGCTFAGNTTVDASKLSFTGLDASAAAGAYSLLTGANNLAQATVTGEYKPQSFDADAENGAKLSATLSGTVSTTADKVQYDAKITLNSVNLVNWDGKKEAAVPDTWTADENGVTVAGRFTEPTDAAPNTSINILTTETDNYFSNAKIDDAVKSKDVDFKGDTEAGVSFSGSQSKGVTASGDGKNLVYAVGKKNVSQIDLGTIEWTEGGTARTASPDAYAVASDATVNANGLSFTFADESAKAALAKGNAMTLLAGDGTGLAGQSVTPEAHSQAFVYTTTHGAAELEATLSGAVTVGEGKISYTADGVTLNKVNILSVDVEKDEVPKDWAARNEEESKKPGVWIDAGSFTTPLSAAGEKKVLLTAETAMFDNANITGDNKYAADKAFSDADKGVAISGTWDHGVYAANEKGDLLPDGTPGTSLVFDAGNVNANQIALGAMTWNTPRALDGKYGCTFADNTTVDASNLTFASLGTSTAAGTYDLLTGANHLAKATITGASHRQDFDALAADDKTETNGVRLSAALNGTVSTTADKVQYEAKVTLNSVDLSGWNGKTSAAVPASWTKDTAGVAVAGVFAEPTGLVPGKPREILTTNTPNYFSDGNIDPSIRCDSYSFSGDMEKGVSFSGAQYKGVRTSDDMSGLVYVANEKNVASVSFGAMTWDEGRIIEGMDKIGYDFAEAEADASVLSFQFTDEQKAALAAGSGITLLSGATNLKADTKITGASHTQDFDATAANGVNLSATLAGTVSSSEGTIQYTANSVTLSSVDLSNWNGSTASTSWTNDDGGVKVVGAAFEPTLSLASEPVNVLTASTAIFNDANIDASLRYAAGKTFTDDTENGVALSGTWSNGFYAADGGRSFAYKAGDLKADTISFGEMEWGTPRTLQGNCDFTNVSDESIQTANLRFTAPEAVTGTTKLLVNATNLAAGENLSHTQDFTKELENVATLSATLSGEVVRETAGEIGYTATATTLNSVSLANWDGKSSAAVPDGWTAANVPVDTGSFAVTDDLMAGVSRPILTAWSGAFGVVSGDNKYQTIKGQNEENGVTLVGSVDRGVKANDDNSVLSWVAGNYIINGVSVGEAKFTDGGVLRTASGEACEYQGVSTVDASSFSLTNPAEVAANQSMTLLKANNTLQDMAAQTKEQTYSLSAEGVALSCRLTGSILADGGSVKYTAASNRADSLAFGNVKWTGNEALIQRPKNISFDGAAVDTSKIRFTNISTLNVGDQTTLVADFGAAMGKSVGETYETSTLQGKGSASLEDGNLIFTAETVEANEKTHGVLMGAGAGMATLAVGNEFIGAATEGLGQTANSGSDGVSTYAKMGGGSIRQETGSHVDIHSWNAVLALGHKNEKEKSTFEYGAFFEYGSGNYSTFNNGLRGDGSVRYTGGGLLAKWTANHGFYVEGSLRAGNLHGETRSVMRDAADVPYSYEMDAPYWGAHIGAGREISLENGDTVNVFGKFYYNRRNGTNFDAEGRYDLDALVSEVLSVGARYTMKREKWNFYGGLAYEHELDGKARGTINGLAIRGTDASGGSVKLELGATMTPKDSPWSLDLNLTGFAGKKRGVMGGISVGFAF